MIKEEFLHYIWQQKLFPAKAMKTTCGEIVEIIDVGKRNTNEGPDFFNAKIKIGDKLWAGNVEIHLKSSDWRHHRHSENPVYDSVILHVVKQADTKIKRNSGENIPQLELECPQNMIDNYSNLLNKNSSIRCEDFIKDIPGIFISSWLNALLSERLLRKTEQISALLEQNRNNWEEAFYVVLSRSFGFGINNEPFERLAKSLPLVYLQKHKNNLVQLEALFFGQAGLLPEEKTDTYVETLKREYDFLKSKFKLTTMEDPGWKMLRLRPGNFPQVRIAQFASLIYASSKMFSKIIAKPEYDYIHSLFSIQLSEYWDTHYTFNKTSPKRTKHLGKKAIDILLINTIVPFLFYYGQRMENEDLQESALKILEQISPEKNNITEEWTRIGIKLINAFDTQAVIQLKNNYCDNKDCLRCRIGHKVLTK
jgi:hypothetical protein